MCKQSNKNSKKKKTSGCKSPTQKSPKRMTKAKKINSSKVLQQKKSFETRSMSMNGHEDIVKKFEKLNLNLEKLNQKEHKFTNLIKEVKELKAEKEKNECLCEKLANVERLE
mmetsp:Transcript_37601/g.37153  ORF Transcript_37601/g.37153 Transcript_37601/m.37153 type:complete len:112 (-) Transcript_37601:72-407(-)